MVNQVAVPTVFSLRLPTSPGPAAGGAVPPPSTLPIPADQYQGSIEPHTWVKGCDTDTYRRVGGAVGAATGAFSTHLIVPLAGTVLGAQVGTLVGGPIGMLVGGAVGFVGAGWAALKTLVPRAVGAAVGAVVGDVAGRAAHALHIPLRSDQVEDTKNYTLSKMASHLNTTSYTAHPRINEADADAFIQQLQPGDIVATNDEAATVFSLLVAAVNGKADFNHALIYQGDGKTIEARTVTHGVAEGVLKDVLMHKHHAVAIRPQYQPGQAEAMVAAGRAMVGRPYDYKFRLNNDALYCSEFVYEAMKQSAPQIHFTRHAVVTREVVLPGDFLHTHQADVVADVGTDRTMGAAYLGKFV